ncbi:MAG: hypothetical protein KF891_24965 [Rhizobacter sp.]|nr:hypothetical protein [Rhizobacter sp.]
MTANSPPIALSPYASFVAMHTDEPSPDGAELLHELLQGLERADPWLDSRELVVAPSGFLDPFFAGILVEERPVPWDKSSSTKDKLNHLLIGFIDGQFALIYVSDPELKSSVHAILLNQQLTQWKPVDEAVLNTAFLHGHPLRALWLGGVHRAVDVKADSKVLSGRNLGDALDPFGDSTFIAGAARSSRAGVSLKRSGVWLGPQADWGRFCSSAQDLLSALRTTITGPLVGDIHPSLARTCKSLAGVHAAYQVEWADPETVEGVARIRQLDRLAVDFEIDAIGPGLTSRASVQLTVSHRASGLISTLELVPQINRGRVSFDISGTAMQEFDAWVNAIAEDAELVRVYYDSGHTIANATLSLASVGDREFNNIVPGNFQDGGPPSNPYKVECEKPAGTNLAAMLTAMLLTTDRSLFQWVFKRGLTQLNLQPLFPGLCWLYCDDGSGEIADFIHVYKPLTGDPRITVIHVKGAKSGSPNRQISAGAYEIVLGQATKNLRRIAAGSILAKISGATVLPGPDRTWDSPWPNPPTVAAAAGLSAALSTIGANCQYEVVVVQPQVMLSKYLIGGQPSRSTRAMQLRSLLFGAKIMANSVGATFRVVFDSR